MRKQLLSFFLGIVTFAVGVVAIPSSIFEIRGEPAVDADQDCFARTLYSESGAKVIHWSCRTTTKDRSPKEDFESQVEHYSIISRSGNRAVVSYFSGDSDHFCVLRLDGDRQNDICSRELEPILEFERDYFGH